MNIKDVVAYVEDEVKNHTSLLKVTVVVKNGIGQVNVQHVLSDTVYNVFECKETPHGVRVVYIDNNFKECVRHTLKNELRITTL
ncbi:hypothetical protein [Escherichia phage vB_vPM_PD114]|nr:hypothetical protein [Escherichia phage vB_vPM_PD114]